MQVDLEGPNDCNLYALATHIVLPRPIAWVTSLGATGIVNLAPFSYFGLVSDDPIVMVLSVGRRKNDHKDTARNLLEMGEAVIHVVEEALFEPMVMSAKDFATSQSEAEHLGLATVPSMRVRPPRLARANVALECKVDRHLEVGTDRNDLFLLRAVYAHVSDEALKGGLPDFERLRIIGKLGAGDYAVAETIKNPR